MVTSRRFSSCLFLVLAVASLASVAEAQTTRTRAIVLSFEGWHADQARTAAVDGLSAAYDLITEQTAIDTAGQMGVDPATPEGMGAVVAQLHIELVVGGTVAGTGRSAETTVWVTDTQGNQLSTRTVRGPGTGRRGGTEIGNAALEACAEGVMSLHPVGPQPQPQPRIGPTEPVAQPQPQPEPEPEADPTYDIENEVAGESRGQRQDRERRARGGSEPSGPSMSGRWNQPIFRGLIGVDIRNRVASASPGADVNRFDADFAPTIQVLLETRPFAGQDDALRGLYAYAWTEVSAGLSYFPDAATYDTATMTMYGFDVGAGYAGTIAEIFELVGTIGFGMDGVGLSDLDRDTQPAHYPSAMIQYVRPGIQARIRLVPDYLILESTFGGRILVGAGDLNTFGAPSGGGIDWSLGLAGIIDPGFTWQVRFGYSGNYITYGDPGDGAPFLDSGVEEAWRILIGIGWAFR
jgi:hypothetical protein